MNCRAKSAVTAPAIIRRRTTAFIKLNQPSEAIKTEIKSGTIVLNPAIKLKKGTEHRSNLKLQQKRNVSVIAGVLIFLTLTILLVLIKNNSSVRSPETLKNNVNLEETVLPETNASSIGLQPAVSNTLTENAHEVKVPDVQVLEKEKIPLERPEQDQQKQNATLAFSGIMAMQGKQAQPEQLRAALQDFLARYPRADEFPRAVAMLSQIRDQKSELATLTSEVITPQSAFKLNPAQEEPPVEAAVKASIKAITPEQCQKLHQVLDVIIEQWWQRKFEEVESELGKAELGFAGLDVVEAPNPRIVMDSVHELNRSLQERDMVIRNKAASYLNKQLEIYTTSRKERGEVIKVNEQGITLQSQSIINGVAKGTTQRVIVWNELSLGQQDTFSSAWQADAALKPVVTSIFLLKEAVANPIQSFKNIQKLISSTNHPLKFHFTYREDQWKMGMAEAAAKSDWGQLVNSIPDPLHQPAAAKLLASVSGFLEKHRGSKFFTENQAQIIDYTEKVKRASIINFFENGDFESEKLNWTGHGFEIVKGLGRNGSNALRIYRGALNQTSKLVVKVPLGFEYVFEFWCKDQRNNSEFYISVNGINLNVKISPNQFVKNTYTFTPSSSTVEILSDCDDTDVLLDDLMLYRNFQQNK